NGFVLSALGVFFAKRNTSFNQLLVPILILSYPIFDISLVTFTRLKEGRKIYQGGKDHTSHRFMNLGFQLKNTLNYIYLISLGLGAIALLVFFFIESPWKVLIAFCVGILLAILGAHLHRRFARVEEKLILIFLDILAINTAFLFFYWLRFESGVFNTLVIIPLSEYIIPAIWITLYWLVLFAILGLYEIKCELPLKDEWLRVFKATILGIMIFFILSIKIISIRFVLLYSLSLVFLLMSLRTIFILAQRKIFSSSIGLRKTLILGTDGKARGISRLLQTESNPGFNVLGFVSEGENHPEDLKVLGCFEDLDKLVKKTKAEVLIFALEDNSICMVSQILRNLEEVEVDIVVREDLSRNFIGFKKRYFYKGDWLRIFPNQLRTWELGIKRILDLSISFLLILIVSPIWLVVSFFISVNYQGGILLKRKFLGKGGKDFRLLSFNSGPLDSQNRLGDFLRNSGLVNFPVFLNVLKGEMSLVGPHPFEKESLNFLPELIEYYKRVELKPGIYGLEQKREESSSSENISRRALEDGFLYAEKISLWLDIRILFKQLLRLFFRR
ncbi:MAG: sugar transferase, partial [candidate division Zixibacteria bacterium]|nr:sugar transferase [candidate division Zixibacteria bacterium]